MQYLQVRGARQNNLKNINLDLPRRSVVVVSGVSGSGKSSLVFDTIYAEGQRRYVESLSTYTKQFLERMEKPDVDEISGLSPAIAIRQQNTTHSARSTVGTATEVSDYLRLLFARIAELFCPKCNRKCDPTSPSEASVRLLSELPPGTKFLVLFQLERRDRQSASSVIETLQAAGFIRMWQSGRVVDLDPPPCIPSTWKKLDVVVDRLVARVSMRSRLTEAFETAYRAGSGRCSVVVLDSKERLEFSQSAACPYCKVVLPSPSPGLFSFNNPVGACEDCRGFGSQLEFDESLIIPDPDVSLQDGALVPWTTPKFQRYFNGLTEFCGQQNINMQIPWRSLSRRTQRLILEGTKTQKGVKGLKGVLPFLKDMRAKSYKKYARFFTRRFLTEATCQSCDGRRLKREVRCYRINDRDISDLTAETMNSLAQFFADIELSGEAKTIADDVLEELRSRLLFLSEVGLGYLTLDRLTRTLSGGEAQRINLASALGANLVDALYVLDEPTVGMHARDTQRLLKTLRRLRDSGNSILVVEHDLEVIAAADYFVDLGPGAGTHGGQVVFAGSRDEVFACRAATEKVGAPSQSRTLIYLRGEIEVPRPATRRKPGSRWIQLQGARLHNLKSIQFRVPVGVFVCVTGVSGSGKSTLVTELLYKALTQKIVPSRGAQGGFDSIQGAHLVRETVLVDASPIGRTPRSNPASYMRVLADIRVLYATTTEARLRRLPPGTFSFNTAGGRCEACEGMGYVQIEMHFMADLFVKCEHCEGQRFQPEVLEVLYKGRSIAEALDMTVDEAITFFHDSPSLGSKLYVLQRAGLGYLRLGQAAPTLSGGESQRLKIARALASKQSSNMLYIFDEPTTGLHLDDVARLLRVMHELVERGHSVVMIEHHLDAILAADWIIDLGPEAGDGGGHIVYQGPPEGILDVPESHTGQALGRHLAARSKGVNSKQKDGAGCDS